MAVESPTLSPLQPRTSIRMPSSSEKDVEGVQKFASYPLIPRPHIELGQQLGRGAYGSVYKGTWNNGDQSIVVAVKKVFMLEKEADILSKVRHRNIIQFFGVCHTSPDFFIVTEFAENGCLFEYLHERDVELDFEQILSWALHIAHGVQYLHCEAPVTIIHRDLKSKNVVLGRQLVCKLCDFGTSKDLTHSYTQPSWGGTAAWMSPEIINQHDKITTASDVWSFAVLLWELTSREIPYKGLSEFKIYTIISTLSERLVIPDYCPKQLANLLHSCWRAEPDERPKMREVVAELEKIRQNEELNEEVATFVCDATYTQQWKEDIGRQLKQLDELKLDLARKSEELDRRERALRKRENSQRNLLLSSVYSNPAASWEVNDVCDWIRNLAAVLATPVDPHVVESLIAIVRKHKICGYRLLEITPHDLDALGIESFEVRAELSKRISDLKMQELGSLQYPSLRLAAQIEGMQKKERMSPFNAALVLHLGLYQRKVSDRPGIPFRYKVFVDSDWKQSSFMIEDLPPEITDSSTVIQHVTLSILSKEKKVLLDTVRCMCPPFGYLEWLDAHEDQSEVTVVCVVTYTDQVLQPRNTCIRTKIGDFSRAATIDERAVSLRLRPTATGTTITRRNSSFLVPSASTPSSPLGATKSSQQNLLALAWRNRQSTTRFVSESPSPEIQKNQPLLGKSPIWAEIAATLKQPRPTPHTKSSPAVPDLPKEDEKPLPTRSISDFPKAKKALRMPRTGRLRKVSFSTAPRKRSTKEAPKDLEKELSKEPRPLKEKTNEEPRPSFYLDNEEEPDSSEGPSHRNDVTPPESPKTAAPLKRCCEKNDCRRQKQKPRTPTEEEENEKAILAEDGRLLRPKKNRRRGPAKQKEKTPPEEEGLAAQMAKMQMGSRSSRNVYGGNNKWSWKPVL